MLDQQKIVRKLLDFWQTGGGVEYNASRHEAVKQVVLKDTLDAAIKAIEEREGKKPIIIATSARMTGTANQLTFHDQAIVWSKKQPVVLIFGTGKGFISRIA